MVDLSEYAPILLFLAVALSLSALFVFLPMGVSRLTGTHSPDPEKLSEYECGFPAFEDSRSQFDVRFYLVAILFIIFDLEAAFLYPWAVSLGQIGWVGWSSMMIFLVILTVGFIYEWKMGALDWE
ncbi:NADH-quinone oxidoreductase subunit A [Parasphingorhabdus sp. JC815]|uniref:NADH-quinone oxidoreductase subunit A n=1 Tax=Parasphingorhabdus sp. JC815 TaxID=3232140 RepID=UPI003457838D